MTAGWVMRAALRRVRRSPLVLLALLAAFAVVAGLGAAADTLARESTRATARLSAGTHVVAYLDAGLPPGDVAALATAFARLPGVSAARAIDSSAALGELKATLRTVGQREDVLDGIEAEILPRSIEITVAPGDDLGARAREVAARLGRLEGVSAVDAMTDGLGQVAGFAALAARLAGLFAAVAGLAAIALLGAIILRERSHHQELAETLHLLGSRPFSMWVPLAIGAVFCAALGGAAGYVLGSWLTLLALGAPLTLAAPALAPALAGAKLLRVLGMLALLGIVVGWLSLPRPRGLVARAR